MFPCTCVDVFPLIWFLIKVRARIIGLSLIISNLCPISIIQIMQIDLKSEFNNVQQSIYYFTVIKPTNKYITGFSPKQHSYEWGSFGLKDFRFLGEIK